MRLLLAIVLVTLAVAPSAAAKELTSATICGANGCTTITDQDRLRELPLGGEGDVAPPPPAAYYTVEFLIDMGRPAPSRMMMLYVPSKTILGWEVYGALTWVPVYGEAIDAMTKTAQNLEPFRAPTAWSNDVRLTTPRPAPGFDWPFVSGSLLVAFALGLTTLLLVRRSRHVSPETA